MNDFDLCLEVVSRSCQPLCIFLNTLKFHKSTDTPKFLPLTNTCHYEQTNTGSNKMAEEEDISSADLTTLYLPQYIVLIK